MEIMNKCVPPFDFDPFGLKKKLRDAVLETVFGSDEAGKETAETVKKIDDFVDDLKKNGPVH